MERERSTVPGTEQAQVARAVLAWLNAGGPLPRRVEKIEAEYLANGSSMGLFAAAAPFKTREFISGTYEAQFQFSLQYRTAPACSEERLEAMEALHALADWAESGTLPELGGGMDAVCVERASPAVMAARYEDGGEDYQIFMVLAYQVRA
ncbi:MAG: hypothetical protein HFF73_02930 [Oscillospiraceae bacterium]|nr:hypothetical protein [Oscillospiraceae bacterium]